MFSYHFNPDTLTGTYTGICRKCGRVLKKMESIRRGIGPTCLGKELGRKNKISQYTDATYPKILEVEGINVNQN